MEHFVHNIISQAHLVEGGVCFVFILCRQVWATLVISRLNIMLEG
jgi:hypothetical protein